MFEDLVMAAVRVIARLLQSSLMLLDFIYHDLPMVLLHKILPLLALNEKAWLQLFTAIIVILSLRETYKLKQARVKLEIDHEFNVARKTIRFNRPPLDTYGEGVVVKGIHIIGKKFDMAINGMEIAGGHFDGRHRARVRGAEEWIKFGSQLVINMNDITEEVVKSGGNVDLEWTLPPREL